MSKPIKKQRWSNIDAFGLLRGLGIWDSQYRTLQYVRRPFDTSLDIRDKIHRLNDSPPSLTKQGLVNGLSNEFGFDSYNVVNNNVFNLSYSPIPSGNNTVQDVWVKYRPVGSTGAWTDIYPQVWGSGYANAKDNGQGFIVWPLEHYSNLDGVKNFNYAPVLEVLQDLDDLQEIQVTYYVSFIDEDNKTNTVLYTDGGNLNDPADTSFQYRKETSISLLSGVTVYRLSDIPSALEDKYYDAEGHAKSQLYKIKDYYDNQYQFTWDEIKSNSALWDLQEVYCSGDIPHFYDAWIPKNKNLCLAEAKNVSGFFSGYLGGVDSLSNSLYLSDLVEIESVGQEWFLKMYPGRFYIDGIPYRFFEDPVIEHLTFTGGVADLPSGLTRGMYTILAMSGYYENPCTEPDTYLSGFVYEDYWAPTGYGGDSEWGYIYRHRPYLTANEGYPISLELGEYNIDFANSKIYLNSLYTSGTLIYDRALLPSGRIVNYDVNPLNQSVVNLQKFFLYLVNKES